MILPDEARGRPVGLHGYIQYLFSRGELIHRGNTSCPLQSSAHFGRNRDYFISCVRSPMWKFGLNSNMVPIYSIDVLGLLTDGPPTHLPNLAPKPDWASALGCVP